MTEAAAFISYQHSDGAIVERLAEYLRNAGIKVWLDGLELQPGDQWKEKIRKAIDSGSAFIACFSANLAARDSSYQYEELLQAIEEIRLRAPNRAWFFPVRLDDTPIEDRDIGGGARLNDIQHVNLFEDFERGAAQLAAALARLQKHA